MSALLSYLFRPSPCHQLSRPLRSPIRTIRSSTRLSTMRESGWRSAAVQKVQSWAQVWPQARAVVYGVTHRAHPPTVHRPSPGGATASVAVSVEAVDSIGNWCGRHSAAESARCSPAADRRTGMPGWVRRLLSRWRLRGGLVRALRRTFATRLRPQDEGAAQERLSTRCLALATWPLVSP